MTDALQVFVRGFEEAERGRAICGYLTGNGFEIEDFFDGDSDDLGGLIETNIAQQDSLLQTDPDTILTQLRQFTGFDGLWLQTREFRLEDNGEYGRDDGLDRDDEYDDEEEGDDEYHLDSPQLPWVIRADGSQDFPHPANGESWTLDELHEIVDGAIEIHPLPLQTGVTGAVMVMNDSGKPKQLPLNHNASLLMGCLVVGDVLVCLGEQIQ